MARTRGLFTLLALMGAWGWGCAVGGGEDDPGGVFVPGGGGATAGGDAGAGSTGGGDGDGDDDIDGPGPDPADAGDAAADAGTDAGGDAQDAGPSKPEEQEPACELPDPSAFVPNPNVGPAGAQFTDSEHFRVYGNPSGAPQALKHLEAAHTCFVEDWCFRSTGLSVHPNNPTYYKTNIHSVASLGSAAGVMQYDARAGLSYLEVVHRSLADPRVTIHEYGHALTLSEYRWVDQTRTGAWWETVANWVADTYLTSRHCERARTLHGIAEGATLINLGRVISQSHLLIVSTQNYYEAWPFLTYLTENPDGYPGLGRMAVLNLFRNHPRNNETPLHVLERVAAPVRVQTILGRYWARMAYLDIGHPKAQQLFLSSRRSLDFASLEAVGNQTYRVKADRRPAYGGANIIPLSGSGPIRVEVTNLGNGRSESNFTATLAIRESNGRVRYVDLPDGKGQANVASGEEASLVVVNTPNTLYQYDAFQTTASSPESIGLNYQVRMEGARPAY
jgi:hypothetical protein